MSADRTAGGKQWVTDTNAILVAAFVLALPAVVTLDRLAGGSTRAVFLTTLAVGFLPAYLYSKLPRQYSPGRAALWGFGVALVVLAVIAGVWAALRGVLGDDGASIVGFSVALLGCLGLVRVWQPNGNA
jgi:VIT1/CCC1 family predicted Fe2+/Mn2+ transporter